MRAVFLLFACLWLCAGCSNSPSPNTASTSNANAPTEDAPAPTEPEAEAKQPLREQLSSGVFQADAAVKKLGDALDLARSAQAKLPADFSETMKDMVAVLDDSGAALADHTGEDVPEAAEVAKDVPKFERKRDDLINAINDVLPDLREQEGVSASLIDDGPLTTQKQFTRLNELFNQIIDDLLGALKALGGVEENLQNAVPDTGDTNEKPPTGFTG